MAVSYVGAGAASATNGGSNPAPTLPAGLAAGDLMLLFVFTRHTGVGFVTTPNGWSSLRNNVTTSGLLAVFSRVYQGGDSAPTVTLNGHTGGASGDTAIAQIAAFRGSDGVPIPSLIFDNASQADIGPIGIPDIDKDGAIVVVGGKRDDWTSVDVLSGDGLTWAEIGETPSTSGADAGIVWDYALNDTGDVIFAPGDKTFTVTGGASAEGRGLGITLAPSISSSGSKNALLIGVG